MTSAPGSSPAQQAPIYLVMQDKQARCGCVLVYVVCDANNDLIPGVPAVVDLLQSDRQTVVFFLTCQFSHGLTKCKGFGEQCL